MLPSDHLLNNVQIQAASADAAGNMTNSFIKLTFSIITPYFFIIMKRPNDGNEFYLDFSGYESVTADDGGEAYRL